VKKSKQKDKRKGKTQKRDEDRAERMENKKTITLETKGRRNREIQ
jgi:hypothetical protein